MGDFWCLVNTSLRVSFSVSFKEAEEDSHFSREDEASVFMSLCVLFADVVFVPHWSQGLRQTRLYVPM